MFDREKNEITIMYTKNPNLLVWGKSGQGKTFFFCREIEKAVAQGQRVLIIDFSGSYTKEEFAKCKFVFRDRLRTLNLCEHAVFWNPKYEREEDFSADLSDALIKVLDINSYFQRSWLRRAVKAHFQKSKNFQMPAFVKTLEALYVQARAEKWETDDIDNIRRLLTRFGRFQRLENFWIQPRKEEWKIPAGVKIYQLSLLPEQEKQFLSELLLELFWKSVQRRQNDQTILVLDEFQFLPLRDGNAFFSILREGRKFGLSAFLGTQFVSNYDKEKLESLLQAGTILIFKPTPRDMKFSAGIIDPDRVKTWQGVLQSLDVGEAVLVGNYVINHGVIVHSEPLVCKV